MTQYKPSYCGALLAGLEKPTTEQILLAYIGDKLANLVWMLSEDGQKRRNQPKSMLATILNREQPQREDALVGYDTPEEFLEAMKKYE